MANRPNFIDLRSTSQTSLGSTGRAGLRSPRLHIAGEVPPELSPLDAFAMQSRLLARQLEEAAKDGSRLSRLPPLTTASPLIVQGRSDYFRSMSQDCSPDRDSPIVHGSGLGLRTEVDDNLSDELRPQSMHPRMSRIPPTPEDPSMPGASPFSDQRGRQLGQIYEDKNQASFGARREQSPGRMSVEGAAATIGGSRGGGGADDTASLRREGSLNLPSPRLSRPTHQSPDRLSRKSSFDAAGLLPPRSLFPPRRSSSITSSPLEPTDEAAMSSSFSSLPPRKLSASSSSGVGGVGGGHGGGGYGGGYGSYSPAIGPYHRSPSVASESAAVLPRPAFNFSRPMSRADTPGPERQPSCDSQPSFASDDMTTPVSMHSESFADDRPAAVAPSYIYSKFDLPRGKMLQRSVALEAAAAAAAAATATATATSTAPGVLAWQPPAIPASSSVSSTSTTPHGGAPPSPPTRPSTSSDTFDPASWPNGPDKHGTPTASAAGVLHHPSPNPSRPPSAEPGRGSEDTPSRGRPHELPRLLTAISTTTAATTDTASTLRAARSQHSFGPSVYDMSAEEHLAKGIECHENGSVNESAYHLRHAARAGHPTGMLLYALACRHGWGMRPNQAEGVRWLKKAAECASHEIADDECLAKEGKFVDSADRRTRKAQFALSIYELGVSHMNGWGIDQDKTLALRCFEIAGSWGDIDALTEAGFCYAKGVGCKKDLKKSAKFYRMAEAKGVSMVGNSWIHKAKYNDDEGDRKKRARSKSRTRAMFGLKSAGS